MGIEAQRRPDPKRNWGGKGTGVALILGLVAVYVPDEGLLVDIGMTLNVGIVRELKRIGRTLG